MSVYVDGKYIDNVFEPSDWEGSTKNGTHVLAEVLLIKFSDGWKVIAYVRTASAPPSPLRIIM